MSEQTGRNGGAGMIEGAGMTEGTSMRGAGEAGARLTGRGLRVGYHDRTILHELDIDIPDGSFTVINERNNLTKTYPPRK